ncbi:MAG: DUF4279 domain-containing protein [Arenicellales bacterium]
MASNEGRVFFSLAGYQYNPDEITELLGLTPTTVVNDGASSPTEKPAISVWELSLDNVAGDVDIFALTDDLIKLLEPEKDAIINVIESHNLSPKLGVVLTLSTDENQAPLDLGFRGLSLKFLSDIGAVIDVDYALS